MRERTLTMDQLFDMGIIEYITPGEQENIMLASCYDTLWENQHNPLHVYTHCDIPVAMFGFGVLLCPLGAHNPASRAILASQQYKQSCGWYSLAWPFRIDKEAYIQFNCEMPLVKTIANDFTYPNGLNCIMAVQIYGGYNQED